MDQPRPSLSERFSAQVRAHLAFRRLSVGDLANGTGISDATLYRRINEGSRWPLDQAAQVAEWFGFDTITAMLDAGAQEPATPAPAGSVA